MPSLCCFSYFRTQNAGLVDVKRDLHSKRSKGILCAKNEKKMSMAIKNVIWSEKTLMYKAERPSNYFFFNSFTYNQII